MSTKIEGETNFFLLASLPKQKNYKKLKLKVQLINPSFKVDCKNVIDACKGNLQFYTLEHNFDNLPKTTRDGVKFMTFNHDPNVPRFTENKISETFDTYLSFERKSSLKNPKTTDQTDKVRTLLGKRQAIEVEPTASKDWDFNLELESFGVRVPIFTADLDSTSAAKKTLESDESQDSERSNYASRLFYPNKRIRFYGELENQKKFRISMADRMQDLEAAEQAFDCAQECKRFLFQTQEPNLNKTDSVDKSTQFRYILKQLASQQYGAYLKLRSYLHSNPLPDPKMIPFIENIVQFIIRKTKPHVEFSYGLLRATLEAVSTKMKKHDSIWKEVNSALKYLKSFSDLCNNKWNTNRPCEIKEFVETLCEKDSSIFSFRDPRKLEEFFTKLRNYIKTHKIAPNLAFCKNPLKKPEIVVVDDFSVENERDSELIRSILGKVDSRLESELRGCRMKGRFWSVAGEVFPLDTQSSVYLKHKPIVVAFRDILLVVDTDFLSPTILEFFQNNKRVRREKIPVAVEGEDPQRFAWSDGVLYLLPGEDKASLVSVDCKEVFKDCKSGSLSWELAPLDSQQEYNRHLQSWAFSSKRVLFLQREDSKNPVLPRIRFLCHHSEEFDVQRVFRVAGCGSASCRCDLAAQASSLLHSDLMLCESKNLLFVRSCTVSADGNWTDVSLICYKLVDSTDRLICNGCHSLCSTRGSLNVGFVGRGFRSFTLDGVLYLSSEFLQPHSTEYSIRLVCWLRNRFHPVKVNRQFEYTIPWQLGLRVQPYILNAASLSPYFVRQWSLGTDSTVRSAIYEATFRLQ